MPWLMLIVVLAVVLGVGTLIEAALGMMLLTIAIIAAGLLGRQTLARRRAA